MASATSTADVDEDTHQLERSLHQAIDAETTFWSDPPWLPIRRSKHYCEPMSGLARRRESAATHKALQRYRVKLRGERRHQAFQEFIKQSGADWSRSQKARLYGLVDDHYHASQAAVSALTHSDIPANYIPADTLQHMVASAKRSAAGSHGLPALIFKSFDSMACYRLADFFDAHLHQHCLPTSWLMMPVRLIAKHLHAQSKQGFRCPSTYPHNSSLKGSVGLDHLHCVVFGAV
eukprot:5181610-Amphidinium_carterae.2